MPDVQGWDRGEEIGDGHWLLPFVNGDRVRVGYIETHQKADGTFCAGSVWIDTPEARTFAPQGPFWTVVQEEPLTLAPSILCRLCGNHGWVRDGRWLPA